MDNLKQKKWCTILEYVKNRAKAQDDNLTKYIARKKHEKKEAKKQRFGV